MQHAEHKNIPGFLMLVDFEEAFDSVSWNFLDLSLQFFGFKDSFRKWVKVLNTEIKGTILQCGTLSEFFAIGRG